MKQWLLLLMTLCFFAQPLMASDLHQSSPSVQEIPVDADPHSPDWDTDGGDDLEEELEEDELLSLANEQMHNISKTLLSVLGRSLYYPPHLPALKQPPQA